ncbi:MAG: nucleotidyltransferase domain-containing protein [Armatimonadota bacterium]|nr:nucleotidyltransferase domain-containing protein [Armatimonadota bacterium]
MRISSPRYSRQQVLDALQAAVPRLRGLLPLRRVVLFGSCARGDFTAASDVDLLVVYADPPRPDAFAVVRRAVGLRNLEPHVFAEGEFRAAAARWRRQLEEGVVLYEE